MYTTKIARITNLLIDSRARKLKIQIKYRFQPSCLNNSICFARLLEITGNNINPQPVTVTLIQVKSTMAGSHKKFLILHYANTIFFSQKQHRHAHLISLVEGEVGADADVGVSGFSRVNTAVIFQQASLSSH